MLEHRTCDICGKEFIEQPLNMYKIIFATKVYHCCSYTCYNSGLQVKERSKQADYVRWNKELRDEGTSSSTK